MNPSRLAWLDRPAPAALLRWEGALVCLLAWACMLAIPLSLGEVGLGWDALNHHIYLGWTAERQRFDLDFLGAGYQSFQAPYLYWPVYRMAVDGWSGVPAGAVLVSLHLLVVWPVWMLARACVPGATPYDLILRACAVALGLLSGVVISGLASTMNDVLAAAPLVWAVALALEPIRRGEGLAPRISRRYVLASGLCAGLAVAFKLSQGPLAILMPLLWWAGAQGLAMRLRAALLGSVASLAGFVLGYGPWGWLLWRHFGNPVYPFFHPWFAPLRSLLGWTG